MAIFSFAGRILFPLIHYDTIQLILICCNPCHTEKKFVFTEMSNTIEQTEQISFNADSECRRVLMLDSVGLS